MGAFPQTASQVQTQVPPSSRSQIRQRTQRWLAKLGQVGDRLPDPGEHVTFLEAHLSIP